MANTARILLGPNTRAGSAIVGEHGRLRLIEPKNPRCVGYANACVCGRCMERAEHRRKVTAPSSVPALVCSCDRPLLDELNCIRCGHRVPLKAA